MKRQYRFGPDYLTRTCKLGVAMIRGEKYYFVTDRYNYWLVTDMDPMSGTYQLQVWDKPRFKKPKGRPSHRRKVHA
jgi:hypothetical protein